MQTPISVLLAGLIAHPNPARVNSDRKLRRPHPRCWFLIPLAYFAIQFSVSISSGQNNVYYCPGGGHDTADLTNGVRVHFAASVPDGADLTIPVTFDGQLVCFRMHAVKGLDLYARQYDCGSMLLNA